MGHGSSGSSTPQRCSLRESRITPDVVFLDRRSAMLILSVAWFVLGALLGALANGARLGLRARGFTGWGATLGTLGIGAAGAVIFGWLSVLLFGRPFGTPASLWGGVLAAVLVPWLLARLRPRAARS
jgi:hypothetical protein